MEQSNGINRRNFVLGAGAAAIGAAGVLSIAHAEEAAPEEEAPVADEAEASPAAEGTPKYAAFNEEVKSRLRLDTNLIGVKMCESLDDIPADAIRPLQDMGHHMAVCQMFSLARMAGQTIAMTPEDFWCWGPLVGFGMEDADPGTEAFDVIPQYVFIEDLDKANEFFTNYPRLPLYKYAAICCAPLSTMTFEPDVVIAYGTAFQINYLTLCVKYATGNVVETKMDGIDSCVYQITGTMLSDEYKVVFPDNGEITRARTRQCDATLTIPGDRMEEFIHGFEACYEFMGFNFESEFEMPLDYAIPPFYNEVFALWGLDQGDEWASEGSRY